jgi:hypothetical protein
MIFKKKDTQEKPECCRINPLLKKFQTVSIYKHMQLSKALEGITEETAKQFLIDLQADMDADTSIRPREMKELRKIFKKNPEKFKHQIVKLELIKAINSDKSLADVEAEVKAIFKKYKKFQSLKVSEIKDSWKNYGFSDRAINVVNDFLNFYYFNPSGRWRDEPNKEAINLTLIELSKILSYEDLKNFSNVGETVIAEITRIFSANSLKLKQKCSKSLAALDTSGACESWNEFSFSCRTFNSICSFLGAHGIQPHKHSLSSGANFNPDFKGPSLIELSIILSEKNFKNYQNVGAKTILEINRLLSRYGLQELL